MAQRGGRDPAEMRVVHRVVTLQARQRARSADQRQFPPQPVGSQHHAQPGRLLHSGVGNRHAGQPRARGDQLAAEPVVWLLPFFRKCSVIALIGVTPPNHLHPGAELARCGYLDGQAEAVD